MWKIHNGFSKKWSTNSGFSTSTSVYQIVICLLPFGDHRSVKFPSVQFQLWLSHHGPSLLPFGILTLCYGKSPVMNGQIRPWHGKLLPIYYSGLSKGGLDRHDAQLCNPTCFDEFWMENLWHGAVGRYSKSISNFFPGRMVPRLKRGTASETATVSHLRNES